MWTSWYKSVAKKIGKKNSMESSCLGFYVCTVMFVCLKNIISFDGIIRVPLLELNVMTLKKMKEVNHLCVLLEFLYTETRW